MVRQDGNFSIDIGGFLSPFQSRLFANACHAKCAGMEKEGVDFDDCVGLNIVIPGKTKLPPSRKTQEDLQGLSQNDQEEE